MYKPFLLIVLLIQVCLATKQLIFIQQLFRHGARYPIYPLKNDKAGYASQWHSLGELTTQGKKMHYLLGKKISQKYWGPLFKGTQFQTRYNQSKFFFKSTDVNRTIQSCQSHLMGIFQHLDPLRIDDKQAKFSNPFWPDTNATEGPVFPEALMYQPRPIHVEKTGTQYGFNGDFLRSYSPENCPKQDQWILQNQESAFAKQINSIPAVKQAIGNLSQIVGKPLKFDEVAKYYDNYMTSKYLGQDYLEIFTSQTHQRALRYIYTLDVYINLFFTTTQKKVTSSGFFNQTIINIQNAIKDKNVQWVIYSAHDTTVANMLAAMNLTSAQCIYQAYLKDDTYNQDTCIVDYPIYTSSIIFEVYQDQQQDNLTTFKILYGGIPRKIPFCNWQQQCRIEVLKEWYESKIKVTDFLNQCGVSSSYVQALIAVSVLQFAVILILSLIIFKTYLSKKTAVIQNTGNHLKDSLISQGIND